MAEMTVGCKYIHSGIDRQTFFIRLHRNQPVAPRKPCLLYTSPFFNGSISKYMLSKTDNSVVDFCFLIINFGTILSFVKFGNMLFGEKKELTYTRNFFSTLVLALLSLLCLATGLFAGPFLSLFFQMDFSVGLSGYLVKSLIWAGSFLLAVLFYKKVLSKIKRLKSGIDFSLDMNHIALCTGAGFLLILGAGFLSLLPG